MGILIIIALSFASLAVTNLVEGFTQIGLMPQTNWYRGAIAGAFGAFLFSTTRTRALGLEPSSGKRGLRMEAYSRALIGAGAGILVHFAFDAQLLFKAALTTVGSNNDVSDAAQMLLCTASGWSERILPAIISRAESFVSPSNPNDSSVNKGE